MSGRQVELFDDLDRVAADAAGALDAQPEPYDRLSWWRRTAADISGIRPLVARARDGSAAAWLPLSRNGNRLEPLGSWYTLSFSPVFAGPAAQRAPLLAAIARRLRGTAPRLMVWPLTAASAEDLRRALRAGGWIVRLTPSSANWRAEIASGWQSYWARRPSRLRHTVARKRKASTLSCTVLTTLEPGAWAAFADVFANSWKPAEGSPAFLDAFAADAAGLAALRLAIASDAEGPVAAQLWTVEGRVATLHKLAHRRDRDRLSPGTLLTAFTIERLCGEGVKQLDFGTGDDAYKADWAEERRALFTLEAADPRTSAGLLAVARWWVAALVRARRTA